MTTHSKSHDRAKYLRPANGLIGRYRCEKTIPPITKKPMECRPPDLWQTIRLMAMTQHAGRWGTTWSPGESDSLSPWRMHKNLRKFKFKQLLLAYLVLFLGNCNFLQSLVIQLMTRCRQSGTKPLYEPNVDKYLYRNLTSLEWINGIITTNLDFINW